MGQQLSIRLKRARRKRYNQRVRERANQALKTKTK